jgi:spore germination cell wall hydrolase CwlJ-like protein
VSIAIGAAALTVIPSKIAFQDLGALLARQPAVTKRWQQHLIASPFGTIHAAMLSLPRPVGTAIPHPPIYALANFDPLDITGSIGRQLLGDGTAPLQFQKANRKSKGDLLVVRPREPVPPLPAVSGTEQAPPVEAEAAQKEEADGRFEPYAKYEFLAPGDRSSTPDVDLPYVDMPPADLTPVAPPNVKKDSAQLYFGIDSLAGRREGIAPWAPGEAPVVLASRGDTDIKQSALSPQTPENDSKAGESVASKGEVTGVDQRPRSPAERLALSGVSRAKAEKCLANAVYFESRGESVRGQIAVAQVVLNGDFSPFYPNDVCGVDYQNAHRHNACQFTFACDGIPDIVTEADAWEHAKRITRDMLGGKLWMPEVSQSTHYHAEWVRPDWDNEMKKIYKLGVHTSIVPAHGARATMSPPGRRGDDRERGRGRRSKGL